MAPLYSGAMRRPRVCTAAAIECKIRWVDKLKGRHGEFDSDKLEIRVRSKLGRNGGGRHVLWHECKHFLWWAYGITPDLNDREESMVNQMSGPEVEFLRSNPGVAEWIFGE